MGENMTEAYVDENGRIRIKFDRLEMETQIMSCWNVTTDLKDLTEGVLEHDMSQDQIANALMGMQELYEIRFDKLFRIFEQLVNQHGKTLDQ
jgi:hypothetical protein